MSLILTYNDFLVQTEKFRLESSLGTAGTNYSLGTTFFNFVPTLVPKYRASCYAQRTCSFKVTFDTGRHENTGLSHKYTIAYYSKYIPDVYLSIRIYTGV